jgi:undecaprenyl-diphosphatase
VLIQDGPALEHVSLLAAVVMGVVEGLTEFLPVSSTGHLILAGALIGVDNKTLEIGIQMGAITAILVLYGGRLTAAVRAIRTPGPGPNLLLLILVGALPAGLLGLVLNHWLKAHLFSAATVAWSTAIGGALLLWLERWFRAHPPRNDAVTGITLRQAFVIGLFQCLALIPGTSRSGATMAGAMLVGTSRPAAAEFSFLLGLPILYGACGYELLKQRAELQSGLLLPFLVGTLVAFLSALAVVRPFVRFLRTHTFAPFAYYRLALGAVVGFACWRGMFA